MSMALQIELSGVEFPTTPIRIERGRFAGFSTSGAILSTIAVGFRRGRTIAVHCGIGVRRAHRGITVGRRPHLLRRSRRQGPFGHFGLRKRSDSSEQQADR